MEHLLLQQLIERLKFSPRVRGVFVTGSAADKLKPWSDLDLVVILDTNTVGLKSIYTMIDGRFADIFFFDTTFVKTTIAKHEVPGMEMPGMFLTWLENSKIEYDPDGLLKDAQTQIKKRPVKLTVTEKEQRDFWIKMNYNFIANSRYFAAKDPIYHQALNIRLAYSVVELITAYFSFRGMPWRGEKVAVEYLQLLDPEYFDAFERYSAAGSVEEKMRSYEKLFHTTLYGAYQKWDKDFVIPVSAIHQYDPALIGFWNTLLGSKNR